MVITVGIGSFPFTQTLNLLVDVTLTQGLILFGNNKVNPFNFNS